MLDPKHKNIGATISMIKIIADMGQEDTLTVAMVKLFVEESKECDYQHITGTCIFNSSLESNIKCNVGNCPLGILVDKELKAAANGIDYPENVFQSSDNYSHHSNKDTSFGAEPETGPGKTFGAGYGWSLGDHHRIGYTGWRKLLHGWGNWLSGKGPYFHKDWRLVSLVITLAAIYIYIKVAG